MLNKQYIYMKLMREVSFPVHTNNRAYYLYIKSSCFLSVQIPGHIL